MRMLIVDHGCCDHPHTRAHRVAEDLRRLGIRAAVCGPSSAPSLESGPTDMYGIHLHAVAAASRVLLAAVRGGDPDAFLAASATVPARLLGLVRETARQSLAEAVDIVYPDVIFVIHAGILTDLAVETGAPVVVHVSPGDLAAASGRTSLRNLVAAAIGSCDGIVAADPDTAAAIRESWLESDSSGLERCTAWPLEGDCAARIDRICRQAIRGRRGG